MYKMFTDTYLRCFIFEYLIAAIVASRTELPEQCKKDGNPSHDVVIFFSHAHALFSRAFMILNAHIEW